MNTDNLSLFHRRLIVSITLSAAFLSVLTQFMLITAFPKIMIDFNVNSTQVQWLTTGYMITMAILIPITAFFIDRFKTRTLIMSAMLFYILGTTIALFAPSFSTLLIGRIVQGIGSGIMIPLMQTILFLVYPKDQRGYAMGLAGMVINVAPAVGPPISGVIIEYFEWRTLFLVALPIALLILGMMYLFMRNITEQRETKIDYTSIFLSIIGFGSMLYGFTQLQDGGPVETLTIISLSVGALALVLFAIRQLRLPKPILELRVLKVPVFIAVALISIFSFSLLISIETILPMFVQNAQEYSPYYGGLIVMPGALTLAVMSMLAGKLFDKHGGKLIAIIGFVLLGFSTIAYYLLLDLNTSFIITAILFMVAMGGVALINMPVMTIGINALPDKLIPHGTAVINTARQFGGTLGLTFIISFISRAQGDSDVINTLNYLNGVKSAFLVAFVFAIIGLILTLFIKEK